MRRNLSLKISIFTSAFLTPLPLIVSNAIQLGQLLKHRQQALHQLLLRVRRLGLGRRHSPLDMQSKQVTPGVVGVLGGGAQVYPGDWCWISLSGLFYLFLSGWSGFSLTRETGFYLIEAYRRLWWLFFAVFGGEFIRHLETYDLRCISTTRTSSMAISSNVRRALISVLQRNIVFFTHRWWTFQAFLFNCRIIIPL